jgi:uncharacterized protein YyaL (SSP411 family)
MIRDRDRIYSTIVTRRLRAMGIRDAVKGGTTEYYVSDNWVYSRDGNAMFHFG